MIKKRYISALLIISAVSLAGTGFSSWVIGVNELPPSISGNIVVTTDIYTISYKNSSTFDLTPSGYVDSLEELLTTAYYTITINIDTNVPTTNISITATLSDVTTYSSSNSNGYLFNELKGLTYTSSKSSTASSASISKSADKKSAYSTIRISGYDASSASLSLTLNYIFTYDATYHSSIYDNITNSGASLTFNVGLEVS